MRRERLFLVLLIACFGAVLSSCGGNGGGHAPLSGRLTIEIDWPARGRLIPDACESIKVTILAGSEVVTERVIARPAGPGPTETTINELPAIPVMLKAEARPSPDGTGTPQAQGSVQVILLPNQTVPASITMASTIDEVRLTTEHQSIQVGDSALVTASAFDADDRLVLTNPARWTWGSNSGNLSLAPNGLSCQVTGQHIGLSELKAKETESGKEGTVQIDVTSGVATSYTLTEVCPLGTESVGNGLNDLGHVVGYFRENGQTIPFVNRGAGPEALPVTNFTGFQSGEAVAINNSGKIAGWAIAPGTGLPQRIAVWYADRTHLLLPDGGESLPFAMNDSGAIVGRYRAGFPDDFGPAQWAMDDSLANLFRTSSGGLSIAINGDGAVAYAVNEGGVWNGYFNAGTDQLLQGSGTTQPIVIKAMFGNKSVGSLGGFVAIWTGTEVQTLTQQGVATGINEDGVIVGTTLLGEPRTGFIYSSETGLFDLLSRVSNPAGWRDIFPTGINASGQISGFAQTTAGVMRAVILSPD